MDEKSDNELKRERMQQLEDKVREEHHPLIYLLSRIAIPLSYTILIGLIFSLVVQTFTFSVERGIRGLVVAILPPLITNYFSLFNHLFRHPKHIQKIPLYFANVCWMVMTFAVVRFLVTHPGYGINWGILLLSITFSALIFSRKYIPFAASLSCSYGVITGLLIYIALFGL